VLQQACEQAMAAATELLRERGASEAEALKSVLRNQRQRIRKTLNQRSKELNVKLSAAEAQLMDVIPGLEEMVVPVLDARTLSKQEERQLRADQKHWQRRLEVIEAELSSEPKRIVDSYRVVTHRLEPAGLVYLWPISG
jgi:broad specificity phosphatase PhoE